MGKQEFIAKIQQHETKNAAYIEPPFDVQEVYGAKRVKVKVTFDEVSYRGSIVLMGGKYMLGMTQEIRNQLGKTFGEEVFVTIEKDEEERTVEIPKEFLMAMKEAEEAEKTFHSLSYTAQKEYIIWITSAKREETKAERINKSIEQLKEGKKLRG